MSNMELNKDQVEVILKEKIIKAVRDGSVWTNDWDNESLSFKDSNSD